MDRSYGEGGSLLELDSNLVACVLLHLQPADLAQVAQTCSGLARETDADVVWCTLFLRRFGSDFWGEATPGPHPYTAVPPEHNEWLGHVTDLFARFSLKCQHHRETLAADADAGGAEEEEESQGLIENHLMEFVRSHATTDAGGYGGWKAAYRRMHDMVTEWRKPVNAAYIVAGLPAFSTLSTITDVIKQGALKGFPGSQFPSRVDESFRIEADVVSPGGQCRVIRMNFTSPDMWDSPVERVANICVIRKPRNWYMAGESTMFRGLEFGYQQLDPIPKLIYVVDGKQMELDEHYQELVYRELHGVLGEGKGHFRSGLAVNLYLLNTTTSRINAIIDRLKVRPFTTPNHMCPYYAGRVYFLVTKLYMATDYYDDDDGETQERLVIDADDRMVVANSFGWLAQQPSSRPHWNIVPFLLCTLTD